MYNNKLIFYAILIHVIFLFLTLVDLFLSLSDFGNRIIIFSTIDSRYKKLESTRSFVRSSWTSVRRSGLWPALLSVDCCFGFGLSSSGFDFSSPRTKISDLGHPTHPARSVKTTLLTNWYFSIRHTSTQIVWIRFCLNDMQLLNIVLPRALWRRK